jgi:hypothetical protein
MLIEQKLDLSHRFTQMNVIVHRRVRRENKNFKNVLLSRLLTPERSDGGQADFTDYAALYFINVIGGKSN